jgi:hypothetical protein
MECFFSQGKGILRDKRAARREEKKGGGEEEGGQEKKRGGEAEAGGGEAPQEKEGSRCSHSSLQFSSLSQLFLFFLGQFLESL